MSEAIVLLDRSTPYLVLVEVLYTLGQSEIAKYHLMSLPGTEPKAPAPGAPPAPAPPLDAGGSPLKLSVWITGQGIGLHTSAGNVATGCGGTGPGLALPSKAGYDFAGLAACAERLKGALNETSVTLSADPGIASGDVLDAMDALRERGGRSLFPDVSFGIARP